MTISEIMELALKRLEEQKQAIEEEITELRSKLGDQLKGHKVKVATSGKRRGRPSGKMSAAHRKAISDRMKQSWAKRKAVRT